MLFADLERKFSNLLVMLDWLDNCEGATMDIYFLLYGCATLGSLVGMVSASRHVANKTAQPNDDMQAVLDELASLSPKPLETLAPDEARQQPGPVDAVNSLLKKRGRSTEPEAVGSVSTIKIPGPAGSIEARVYLPRERSPLPILVYWHGGGWVIANLDAYDASCRALCNAAHCIVVSCEYRRAPENPFSAAIEDAFAAYQWVVDNAPNLGGDPDQIAVGGESAGGNLAAVTALQARDYGVRAPVHQMLIYPVTDCDFETESYKQHANAKPLNRAMMKWFWGHYLYGTDCADNPYLTPLRAEDLSHLPPATIITADIDPLRSDGERYARKLEESGVTVNYENFAGVTHEFFGMTAVLAEAREAVALAAQDLLQAFQNVRWKVGSFSYSR
jgi:acetyl esterase